MEIDTTMHIFLCTGHVRTVFEYCCAGIRSDSCEMVSLWAPKPGNAEFLKGGGDEKEKEAANTSPKEEEVISIHQ